MWADIKFLAAQLLAVAALFTGTVLLFAAMWIATP